MKVGEREGKGVKSICVKGEGKDTSRKEKIERSRKELKQGKEKEPRKEEETNKGREERRQERKDTERGKG